MKGVGSDERSASESASRVAVNKAVSRTSVNELFSSISELSPAVDALGLSKSCISVSLPTCTLT